MSFTVISNHQTTTSTCEAIDWGSYFGHHLVGSGYSAAYFFDKEGNDGRSLAINIHKTENLKIERFSIEGGNGGIQISGEFKGQPFQISLWDKKGSL